MIHVIFASDENYAPHLGVHIRSIAETTPGPITIHVLEKNISEDSKAKIFSAASGFDVVVKFLAVHFEHEVGKKTPDYINEVAMYRLLTPHLLSDVDRAIYIDVDALTASSLVPLWETDLKGNLIALVESPWRKYDTYKLEIGLSKDDPYFNSGTMVMDLKGMRDQGLEKKFIDCFIDKREQIEFPDQDVLNIVLQGKILPLHPKWSVVRALFDHNGRGTKTYAAKEVAEAKASPAIIQFSGKVKPWHETCRHPLGYTYNAVRQRTPWAISESVYGKTPSKRPTVSVIMATRNGENTVRDAIASILHQTFSDLEFIIINDGSTDGTKQILAEAAATDPRIRILTNRKPIGLPSSLNRALDEATGIYFARMDDDDFSEPNRFEEQVKFMDTNPHIHICGTNVTVIRPFWHEPKKYDPPPPENDRDIKIAMLKRPGMIHPTVMMRGDYIRAKHARYNPEFLKAQDYDLWTRLAFDHQAKFHNLQAPLFRYRTKFSDAREIRSAQENAAFKIMAKIANRLGFESEAEVDMHARWAAGKFSQTDAKRKYRDIARHVKNVLEANRKAALFDPGTLEKFVMAQYKNDFKDFYKEGSAGIARFEAFPLKSYLRIPKESLVEYRKKAAKVDRFNKLLSTPVLGVLIRLGIAIAYPNKVFGKLDL